MDKNEHSELTTDLNEVSPHITIHKESYTWECKSISDKIAKRIVKILSATMDFLFKERYNHRAVVLETIAAVPGMVGGLLQHLASLRFIRDDNGWIKILIEEAENERMHLLIYSKIAKPTTFERIFIMIVQFFFYHLYFLLYLISPKTAHRVVGYFEEEAIHSYEHYLELVHRGTHEDIIAPQIAIDYWNLSNEAKLSDVISATIKDEIIHRDVNHKFSSDKKGTTLWW